MRNESNFRREAMRRLSHGEPMEHLLRWLRDAGCSMADSVTIVADAVGMDLADARDLIVDSDTWEDRRDAALELNDQLADAFLEFGVAQDDGSIIVDLTDLDDGTERPKQG